MQRQHQQQHEKQTRRSRQGKKRTLLSLSLFSPFFRGELIGRELSRTLGTHSRMEARPGRAGPGRARSAGRTIYLSAVGLLLFFSLLRFFSLRACVCGGLLCAAQHSPPQLGSEPIETRANKNNDNNNNNNDSSSRALAKHSTAQHSSSGRQCQEKGRHTRLEGGKGER